MGVKRHHTYSLIAWSHRVLITGMVFLGPGPKNEIANVLISVSTQFGTNKIIPGLNAGLDIFKYQSHSSNKIYLLLEFKRFKLHKALSLVLFFFSFISSNKNVHIPLSYANN